MNRSSALIRKFRRDETGMATIEAVMWLPVFYFLFCAVVDVSFVFHRQAEAYRVVQDANRQFSVGRLADEAATQTWIEANVAHVSAGAAATTSIHEGVILTQLVMPIEDLDATGLFGWLADYDVVVSAKHFLEL